MCRLIIAAALAVACTATPATAAIVDWTFLGTVTAISGSPDYAAGFHVGDAWRVDLALNLDTQNLCDYPQAGGAGGVYTFLNMGTAAIGGHDFMIRSGALEMNTQGGNCGIGMSGGVDFRLFTVTSSTDFGFLFPPPISGDVFFVGYPGFAIPVSSAGILGGNLSMRIGTTNLAGRFTEASASVREANVPEPTTLLLFVAGAVALRRRRR